MPDPRRPGRHANQRRITAAQRGDLLENLKRRVNLPHLLLRPRPSAPQRSVVRYPWIPTRHGVPRRRQAGRPIDPLPAQPTRPWPTRRSEWPAVALIHQPRDNVQAQPKSGQGRETDVLDHETPTRIWDQHALHYLLHTGPLPRRVRHPVPPALGSASLVGSTSQMLAVNGVTRKSTLGPGAPVSRSDPLHYARCLTDCGISIERSRCSLHHRVSHHVILLRRGQGYEQLGDGPGTSLEA